MWVAVWQQKNTWKNRETQWRDVQVGRRPLLRQPWPENLAATSCGRVCLESPVGGYLVKAVNSQFNMQEPIASSMVCTCRGEANTGG